jgi:hypothetical protein
MVHIGFAIRRHFTNTKAKATELGNRTPYLGLRRSYLVPIR